MCGSRSPISTLPQSVPISVWGFTFCGLDTTLYDGTASTGEQALFMSRRVR